MRKIFGIFIFLILLNTILPIGINANLSYNPLDGGWLEERDGVKILHLSGVSYDMGYQYGSLLKQEIAENCRMIVELFDEFGWSYDDLIDKWNVMINYIPDKYLNEMKGLADGSDISLEEIGVTNIAHDIINLIYCSGAIMWGSSTIDGELIHLRSADLSIFIRDPVTGKYLQENQVLIVIDPDEGYASMSPVIIGDIGSYGGVNEAGICVGETTCVTNDTTLHGIPASFRMRMVLDSTDNGWDALSVMNSNRTCGWNLLISDGNIPEGYILEQTASVSHISLWNDSIESKKPFWMIEDVLRRSNCFLSPECIELERGFHNPSDLRHIILNILGLDPYFAVWTHYKALSKGIYRHWGSFDLNSSMDMFREVYLGKTDLFFNFMMKRGSYQPINQWAACPKTGDMVMCFASIDKIASYNPVHYFNLFELLNSEPP